ncbi:hypothetical protein E3226_009515 [Legionella geestiana]|uniref:hypothetical protein n=1 Tax=Legionella geestiana TaxID=45065 RepID=UPI0010924A4F|nr:hypothetical protein [Legionella geestiana]QDQ40612.1 hypothetical protein E3226_009515 [Legionella geestiana]
MSQSQTNVINDFRDALDRFQIQVAAYQLQKTSEDCERIRDRLKLIDARFGYGSMVRELNKTPGFNYNHTMASIIEAFTRSGSRMDRYSTVDTLNAFLSDPELVEVVRSFQNTQSQDAGIDYSRFNEVAQKYDIKCELKHTGNCINFAIFVDGHPLYLKVTKKLGRVSRAALHYLSETSEAPHLFPQKVGERICMGEKDGGYDAVSVFEPVEGDVFSLGERLTPEERAEKGPAIFVQMTEIFQRFRRLDITMGDGKGSNWGVDVNGQLRIIDSKSICYLDDIKSSRDEPNGSRDFDAEDANLFNRRVKLQGQALSTREQKVMTHFLGMNMAMFILGLTEQSIQTEFTELAEQSGGKVPEFQAYLREKLSGIREGSPLYSQSQLALELLQDDKNLDFALERLKGLQPALESAGNAGPSSSSSLPGTSISTQVQFTADEEWPDYMELLRVISAIYERMQALSGTNQSSVAAGSSHSVMYTSADKIQGERLVAEVQGNPAPKQSGGVHYGFTVAAGTAGFIGVGLVTLGLLAIFPPAGVGFAGVIGIIAAAAVIGGVVGTAAGWVVDRERDENVRHERGSRRTTGKSPVTVPAPDSNKGTVFPSPIGEVNRANSQEPVTDSAHQPPSPTRN